MSTKITISYGKQYHLWEEIFDKSNVYLRIEGHEYDISNGTAMVQIPIEIWRSMIQDWSLKGWPKEEDNTEDKISEEWLTSINKSFFNIATTKGDKNE